MRGIQWHLRVHNPVRKRALYHRDWIISTELSITPTGDALPKSISFTLKSPSKMVLVCNGIRCSILWLEGSAATRIELWVGWFNPNSNPNPALDWLCLGTKGLLLVASRWLLALPRVLPTPPPSAYMHTTITFSGFKSECLSNGKTS
jgi:hypothetical protein